MEGEPGYRYTIEYDTLVPAAIQNVFAFLMDPRNLAALDPPELQLRVVSARDDGGGGSVAEYVLRWFGIPVYLRTAVAECVRPQRFVVKQLLGPWMHYTHVFELREHAEGTLISQRAEFTAARGWANAMLHRWVIRRQVRAVHADRRNRLPQLFAESGARSLMNGGEAHK